MRARWCKRGCSIFGQQTSIDKRCVRPFSGGIHMGGDKEGKKRSKKGLLAMLLAGIGAVVMVKKRKSGTDDAGWEEAKPNAS